MDNLPNEQNDTDEIWKPIDGYVGLYEVSNMGRVRSLVFRNNQASFGRIRILSPTDNGNGYKIVGLNKGAGRKNYYVHRLVASAFVGNPNNLPVVDHIDHNKANNKASNLQWVTQGENVRRSTHLMSKPRTKATTNTGEKYISQVKGGRFKVSLPWLRSWKSYETLEQAVAARDSLLEMA